MAIIYQIHPQHGRHMALTNLEADANIKSGWKTVSEEEFYDVPRGTFNEEPKVAAIRDENLNWQTLTQDEVDELETEPENNINDSNHGDDIPRAVLEELYVAKFGKKPPANAKDATIKAKLEEQQDE